MLVKKKKYKAGGKLKMHTVDGKKVPFYVGDGKGKMMKGGKLYKKRRGWEVKTTSTLD